ncbi:putative Fungal specific transcription factor protein [Seiridium unicorne]|uniref:Fungal specific transcription factor protein n=1 Tax=Seiridium unicorne TaxID=138068 RepID=A0ABR2UK78_9PEZI
MSRLSHQACVNCARRKVKCDKLDPCSSCSHTQAACIYRTPVPSQRHRRRLAHSDLLCKIQELESLLRENKISFSPLDNSWINSPWEQLIDGPQAQINPGSSAETVIAAQAHAAAENLEVSDQTVVRGSTGGVSPLWAELSEDLKRPPIAQLKRPYEDLEEQSNDISPESISLLIPQHLITAPVQSNLHPEPRHVFKLWQIFADNVNPLTKIIHAPTLQTKIFEAAWSVETITKPLEATMFAVYALAVESMRSTDCFHIFGEDRIVLVSRYRLGALRALSCTNLLSNRQLEVLQALTLVLMIDPQSEVSTTAVALAMRIAHRMGLHRAGEDTSTSFFEQEMRVRLWWYIRGLDSRVRRTMGLSSTSDDLGDLRLPMNVNDADLHPCMTSAPAVKHTAATEMVYCLMKYDLWNFVRKSSNFSGSQDPREKVSQLISSTDVASMSRKKEVLGNVSRILREKYLDHLDQSIPLQNLSASLAGITIHHHQFLMFHPRHQTEGEKCMSEDDQNLVFESSVRLVELDQNVRRTNFSTTLVDHMTCRTQVEALAYMVSELRQRVSGHLVTAAWALLEQMHDEQPEVMRGGHRFYAALSDLTLEAWESRSQALGAQAGAIPDFIKKLQLVRGKTDAAGPTSTDSEGLQIDFMGDFTNTQALYWDHWDDLLQL